MESWFPNLANDGYALTSPEDDNYNCIAWAAGANDGWWQPIEGYIWLPDVPRDYRVESLIRLFEELGYTVCDNGEYEAGSEKVAIYSQDDIYSHAARQLPNGKWTSKLGELADIEHNTVQALEGDEYGTVARFMKRRRRR